MAMMRDALDGAVQANEDSITAHAVKVKKAMANTDVQRRGHILPGDTSNNFGLNNQTNQFGNGFSPFNSFFGSRESFTSFFGPGAGPGFGGGFNGPGGHGQGSLSGFSGNTRAAHFKMGSAVQAYKGFGIIKNVIDLMANFASEGLKIKHPSKNVEKFYARWAEHVGLQSRIKDILRYYYKYSNVFIYTTMGVVDNTTYDRMKRAKAHERGRVDGFESTGDTNDPQLIKRIEDIEEERKKDGPFREIPWRYTLLNPFQMDLRGTKFFGQSRWVFILDEKTATMVGNNKLSVRKSVIDFLDQSKINLPPEFKNLMGEGVKDVRVVNLDQTRLWTLHYMKDDHEDWADPMIWPVMHDIYYKNKMREMDISVCNSVINSITIFKLGDWKNGFVPPKEHFRKFAEFLRAPTAAMSLVWNDAVDVISNHPPVEKILGMQKYESVDRDILRGLGVPDTLIGGATNGNFSTGFLGVRTLLERLEEGRNTVLHWLNDQLRIIAAVMGHRDIPRVRFGKMSLRDEKAEKQLILGLLDRNVISVEAVLETFGEDFAIELERLRDEKKIADGEGILVKHGPFTDPMATMTDDEVMDREDERMDKEADRAMKEKQADRRVQTKMQRETKKQNPNGRPPNSKGIPQEKKRETKPKGMARILDYEKYKTSAASQLNTIEKFITGQLLDLRDKKYKKELTRSDRQAIEDITFVTASRMDPQPDPTDNTILKILEVHKTILPEVGRIYSQMKEDGMSLAERKNTMASALAMFEIQMWDMEDKYA
jgi:hypothetical protein